MAKGKVKFFNIKKGYGFITICSTMLRASLKIKDCPFEGFLPFLSEAYMPQFANGLYCCTFYKELQAYFKTLCKSNVISTY